MFVTALVVTFALPVPTIASTTNTTFVVSTTVNATCTVSATNLSFNLYTGSQTDSTSTISVTCTNGTPYNIGLDSGSHSISTANRQMSKDGNLFGPFLDYALYRDSGRSQNWGNNIGTDTQSGTGSGTNQDLTVYGRINGNQTPSPGSYNDVVTVQVNY